MEKGNSAIMNQAIKLFKHTRSGSYATRDRYMKASKTFIRFLDEKFGMKNLRNLQDKHVVAFIQSRQAAGISDVTTKTDLGAIRFLHDMVPNAKYELSSNEQLRERYDVYLEKRIVVDGDRAWNEEEYRSMQSLLGEQAIANPVAGKVKDVMTVARTMGLRVSEVVCMRRSQAEAALRTGVYEVRGEAKNGLWREVPLSPEVRTMLGERLQQVERGGRVFVREGEKAHEVVNRIEKHLERYRGAVTTSEGAQRRLSVKGEIKPLTFHGLRYNYVQQRMSEEQAKGLSWDAAASVVTKEVGHNRIDVIKIYTNGR